MMNLLTSSSNSSDNFLLLDERIQRWIWQAGWTELKDAQERAIPVILSGNQDVIIAAATASGKTEAAFLPILTRLLSEQNSGSCVIYISPLKALINDQWRRLEGLCETLEIPVTPWHGDISAGKKHKFKKAPVGCLLITPESLESLLMSNGHALHELFGGLRYLVIDEFHVFIGSERGKQLQSLMNRIDIVLKCFTPRIALSATLGDMDKAAEFLRPNAVIPAIVINSTLASQDIKLFLKGFIEAPLTISVNDTNEEFISRSTQAIGDYLFKVLRGSNNLVFPNRRVNVELYTTLLRTACEELGIRNEFYPHHGNLAKEIREETEAALKAQDYPATAICTTTLEMGIDIGSVKSIAQIGSAPSVASLRQRLGRSGRRGEAAILRCLIVENKLSPESLYPDLLRANLVQAIAQIRLLLNKWYEPPKIEGMNLSTLIQQLLSLIAQYSGVTAASAWTALCGSGVFANVSKQDFSQLLRALAKNDILIQTQTGLLLHGQKGEKIVNHYSFYAAFSSDVEFQIIHSDKKLGTVPLSQPIEKGSYLIFSGKYWQVQFMDIEANKIFVIPALRGDLLLFEGDGIAVDDGVRQEMHQVLTETTLIPFLDTIAGKLLQEARATFYKMGLTSRVILVNADNVRLFFWRGDRVMNTVVLMLEQVGFRAKNAQLYIEITTSNPEILFDSLRDLASLPPPEPTVLVKNIMNKWLEKWDMLLPAELLAKNYASHTLDVIGAHEAIKKIVQSL